jgi:acyl-CoA dehydrogenase
MDADLRARTVAAAAVAAEHSDKVDRDARFPQEALDAIRAQGLLRLLICREEGGEGRTAGDVGRVTEILSRACANTGMIYAMHQIQLSALVRHADLDSFATRREEIAERQLLLASATTEIGIGGDVRRSSCAVEPDEHGHFVLKKNAPVISYGEYADAILVTARKDPGSTPNDQVLVYVTPPGLTLEPTSEWNTLGFRGTCSPGYLLTAHGSTDAVLPVPFAEISSQTMLPTSHIFWSSVWLGIASDAVAKARTFVQAAARKSPGVTPPGALRLAELQISLQTFASSVHDATYRYDSLQPGDSELDSVNFAVAMNGLKVSSSTAVVDIVGRALMIVGIAGYREDTPLRMGRHLRDAYGAALMVNNDRILGHTASLELINRRADV